MKIQSLTFCLLALALATCAKGTSVAPCNPKSLWLNFACGEDLTDADGLDIHVVREDGVNASFVTGLDCPGKRSLEVAMPNYMEGQKFNITAIPTTAEKPLGEPNVLANVALEPGCTSLNVALKASPGQKLDAAVQDKDANMGDATDGGSPPTECLAGTLACRCNDNDSCSEGLMCRASTCSAPNCGNGAVDLGEDCDDANATDTDLCSTKCESCGKRAGFLECGPACLAGAQCCPGAPCGPAASCTGETLTARSVCGSDGKCPDPKPAPCDSFLTCADATTCRSTCTADSQCVGGRKCINATCVTANCGNGTLEGEDCDDGNREDGDLCSNACVPCSKRANYLACGTACLAGASCCPGSSCSASACSGSTYTAPATCSAAGQCGAGTPSACPGNFVCEGATCRTSCSSNTHCTANSYCNGGLCAPKLAPGTSCQNANQCSTGNCTNDVCCTTAVCGGCQQCNLKGDGTCSAVGAGGVDTKKMCTDQGLASCGQNGLCDGNGGCQKYACTCDGFIMPNPVSSRLPNPVSYDMSVPGILVDKVTRLAWRLPANSAENSKTYTHAAAVTQCSSFSGGWRLPTVLELYSLKNFQTGSASEDPYVSPNGSEFWTSSLAAGDASRAWVVNFGADGGTRIMTLASLNQIFCVRQNESPTCYPGARFTLTSTEAYDARTGLTWQRGTQITGRNWFDAPTLCTGNFRVPSIKELLTIVDLTKSGPAADSAVFVVGNNPNLWSSSAAFGPYAWYLNFATGSVAATGNDQEFQVRCVR